MKRAISSTAALLVCIAVSAGQTNAATPERPNFAGKVVRMIIGSGPGGGYDLWGRMVAHFIGRHVPGDPNVVPENMPGAGSYRAADYIYNLAPRDGTVMGIIERVAPLGPLVGAVGARFDPLKMSWLGTPTIDTNVCIAERSAKVKTFQDLLKTQLIVGDSGAGNGTHMYPGALNALLGTKFKLIPGFPSTVDVFLAMERGEVDGVCEAFASVKDKRPTWISSGQVNILFQAGVEPNPDIKAPFLLSFAKDPNTKVDLTFLYAGEGIGRPFVAPPGLSSAILETLRNAFDATMTDPDFILEAKKLELHPHDGAYLSSLIERIYATPKPIIDEIRTLVSY